jgi:NADPH:quinone reductase-like Zn-dependent oxidoreductase
MSEFFLGLAVSASISSSIALWVISGRLVAIQGALSSVSHALIALAKERNQ